MRSSVRAAPLFQWCVSSGGYLRARIWSCNLTLVSVPETSAPIGLPAGTPGKVAGGFLPRIIVSKTQGHNDVFQVSVNSLEVHCTATFHEARIRVWWESPPASSGPRWCLGEAAVRGADAGAGMLAWLCGQRPVEPLLSFTPLPPCPCQRWADAGPPSGPPPLWPTRWPGLAAPGCLPAQALLRSSIFFIH